MFVYVISLRKLLENSFCMVFLEIVVVKLHLLCCRGVVTSVRTVCWWAVEDVKNVLVGKEARNEGGQHGPAFSVQYERCCHCLSSFHRAKQTFHWPWERHYTVLIQRTRALCVHYKIMISFMPVVIVLSAILFH